jgi:hypothetical protein
VSEGPSRSGAAHPVALSVRLIWGVALCAAPGRILGLMGGADEGLGPRRIMRVLGARHVVQALAVYQFGGEATRLGVGADLLHGATDVGFGVVDARWRRAALTDAAIATGFAVAGLRGQRA